MSPDRCRAPVSAPETRASPRCPPPAPPRHVETRHAGRSARHGWAYSDARSHSPRRRSTHGRWRALSVATLRRQRAERAWPELQWLSNRELRPPCRRQRKSPEWQERRRRRRATEGDEQPWRTFIRNAKLSGSGQVGAERVGRGG